jgi:hypothetical protein
MQRRLIENVCVWQKNGGERLSERHTQTQYLVGPPPLWKRGRSFPSSIQLGMIFAKTMG